MRTPKKSINKTPTLPLSVAVLVLVIIAVAVYVSLGRQSVIPGKANGVRVASEQELAAVEENYKQHFREGCSLDKKSTVTFKDGTGVSAYFAKCVHPYPQKEYSAGEFMGLNAVYEKDALTGSLFPVIVVSPQKTNLASSSVTALVIENLHKKYLAYLSKLPKEEAVRYAGVDVSFQPMKGAFVMYQIPQGPGKGVYFDRSSVELIGYADGSKN